MSGAGRAKEWGHIFTKFGISLVNPENTDERTEVKIAAGNSWRSVSRAEIDYAQANRQENVPMAAGNSMREDQLPTQCDENALSFSNSTRRLAASTPELRSVEHTNDATFSMQVFKTNVFIWKMFNVLVDESRHPSWAEFQVELGNLQEHKIRWNWILFQHCSEVGNGAFWSDSERKMSGTFITFLGEIGGKSKSMCLCWFRSMGWTDERHSRSDRKMDKSSGRTQVVFVLPRCSGIDGEAIEVEWKTSLSFSSVSLIQEIQRDLEIEWKTNDENCTPNPEKIKNYAMKFSQGHWRFLGPRSEESGLNILHSLKQENLIKHPTKWNSDLKKLVIVYSKSFSALNRGILKQKKSKETIHFNGDSSNTTLVSNTAF